MPKSKILMLLLSLFAILLFSACDDGYTERPREIVVSAGSGNSGGDDSQNESASETPSDTDPSKDAPLDPKPSDKPPVAAEPSNSPPPTTDPPDSTPPAADPSQVGGQPPAAGQPAENPGYGLFPFAFTATDLYGNTVTEATLGEKRLFFVHYWATWCGPCINEMPDLARIARDYADEVGFIALLDDYSSNISGAIRITESAGIPASFIMVDASIQGLSTVLSMVSTGYVPTTAIVEPSGEMFESALIGAYGQGYAIILDSLLY